MASFTQENISPSYSQQKQRLKNERLRVFKTVFGKV